MQLDEGEKPGRLIRYIEKKMYFAYQSIFWRLENIQPIFHI